MSYYQNQSQQFNTVADLCNYLSDYDGEYRFVLQLVEKIIQMGLTPKVYSVHDDFLGMRTGLSNEFMNSSIEFADCPSFSEDAAYLLSEASIVIRLFNRTMTPYDFDVIDEDRRQIGY